MQKWWWRMVSALAVRVGSIGYAVYSAAVFVDGVALEKSGDMMTDEEAEALWRQILADTNARARSDNDDPP